MSCRPLSRTGQSGWVLRPIIFNYGSGEVATCPIEMNCFVKYLLLGISGNPDLHVTESTYLALSGPMFLCLMSTWEIKLMAFVGGTRHPRDTNLNETPPKEEFCHKPGHL